jgi:hypothetical protein
MSRTAGINPAARGVSFFPSVSLSGKDALMNWRHLVFALSVFGVGLLIGCGGETGPETKQVKVEVSGMH